MYFILTKEYLEKQLDSIQELISKLRSVDISDAERVESLACELSSKSNNLWDTVFVYLFSSRD